MKPQLILAYLCVLLGAAACQSKDCVELCEEGQAGDCTTVDGDCGAFCGALDRVKEPAGCGSAYDDYDGCLNGSSAVCDSDCGLEEATLQQCVGSYCVAHAGDADCQTLQASF